MRDHVQRWTRLPMVLTTLQLDGEDPQLLERSSIEGFEEGDDKAWIQGGRGRWDHPLFQHRPCCVIPHRISLSPDT